MPWTAPPELFNYRSRFSLLSHRKPSCACPASARRPGTPRALRLRWHFRLFLPADGAGGGRARPASRHLHSSRLESGKTGLACNLRCTTRSRLPTLRFRGRWARKLHGYPGHFAEHCDPPLQSAAPPGIQPSKPQPRYRALRLRPCGRPPLRAACRGAAARTRGGRAQPTRRMPRAPTSGAARQSASGTSPASAELKSESRKF